MSYLAIQNKHTSTYTNIFQNNNNNKTEAMKTTIHHGPYTTIPTPTTPGLHFLKTFLPALDSLDAESHPIAPFLHPDADLSVNSNPPNKGSQVLPLLEVRSKHLAAFGHEVEVAWDIDLEQEDDDERQGKCRRTVMFEATSSTVFRDDPDQFAVKVKEFNILDIKKQDAGSGSEFQVVQMRTYLDARPVQDRAARLQMGSAYGESKTTG